jgi:succinate dehydrogenase hydrophobic anchor subunit
MFAANVISHDRVGFVTPVWVWLLQRISAVFLGPLVLIHVCMPGAARNPWVGGLLLLVVLSHGFVGLLRLVGRRTGPVSSVLQIVAVLLILLMGVLGGLVLRALL